MKDSFEIFKEAKRQYMIREGKKQQIAESILFGNEVCLKTYTSNPPSEKHTFVFCQKDLDFSNLEKDYYILHEAENDDYHDVQCYYSKRAVGICELVVTNMYILMPKNEEEETLALFVRRYSNRRIEAFDKLPGQTREKFNITTDLFVETSVSVYVEEYNFNKKKQCSEQKHSEYSDFKLEIKKSGYEECIKKYVEKVFIKKSFLFCISASEDYKNYIEMLRKHREETSLTLELKEVFKDFKESKKRLEKFCKQGKENYYKAWENEERETIHIKDENGKNLGFVFIEVPMVFVAICDKEKQITQRTVKLFEGKSYNEVLENVIGKDFKINFN